MGISLKFCAKYAERQVVNKLEQFEQQAKKNPPKRVKGWKILHTGSYILWSKLAFCYNFSRFG